MPARVVSIRSTVVTSGDGMGRIEMKRWWRPKTQVQLDGWRWQTNGPECQMVACLSQLRDPTATSPCNGGCLAVASARRSVVLRRMAEDERPRKALATASPSAAAKKGAPYSRTSGSSLPSRITVAFLHHSLDEYTESNRIHHRN